MESIPPKYLPLFYRLSLQGLPMGSVYFFLRAMPALGKLSLKNALL